MAISISNFGCLSSGAEAKLFGLKAGELSLTLTDFGATLVSLCMPDSRGRVDDILLGFSTLAGYTKKNPNFGSTIGRFANRIGNSRFSLNGKSYQLNGTGGGCTLHGGLRGWGQRLWQATPYEDANGAYVKFAYTSPDGEENFPGTVKVTVSYGITKDNCLVASYEADSDADTPLNLTNHAYFNLRGENMGSIMLHEVKLYSSKYLEVDSGLIPTGKLIPVAGTAFDFTTRKPISRDAQAAGGGYDHCFVVDGEIGKLRPAAELYEGSSGRSIKIETTRPAIQLYTGNFLNGELGKAGAVYGKQSGMCFETQHYPDSPNHADFPSAIFGPSRKYSEKTVLHLGW